MYSEALDQEAGGRNDTAKRRQIMEGARQVFLSSGFDGASMNDVARVAGVSKGTLYAYFNSKDELFEAIIRGEFAQSAERLCTFRREGDAREMLRDFGVRLISRMSEPGTRALARVVISAAEKFPNIGRAQGCRSRARGVAIRRSVPELRLQTAVVRRGRFDQPRGHRGLGRGRGRRVSEGLRS